MSAFLWRESVLLRLGLTLVLALNDHLVEMGELLQVELVVVVGVEGFHKLLQFVFSDGVVHLGDQVVELVKVELAVAAELVLVKEGLDFGGNIGLWG